MERGRSSSGRLRARDGTSKRTGAPFIQAPLYIHNSAKISNRPRCTSAQYSMLVIKSCWNRRQRFLFCTARAYETQINPLCDDPARQFTSSVAVSHCSWSPGSHRSLFYINIAYKCSPCLNCLQKLNGVWKSSSNIPTWACEFIPGSADTEAIEESHWWWTRLLWCGLREIYVE